MLAWAFRRSNFKKCKSVDPKISLPIKQLSAWMRLYSEADEDKKQRILKCWHKTLRKLQHPGGRWMQARGPLAATICTLLDMEWKPLHPCKWKPKDEDILNFNEIEGVSSQERRRAALDE